MKNKIRKISEYKFLDKFENKKVGMLLFCFLIAFTTLLLFSKCSFLYPFNGWDDFNSFYTVGSGWANGLIPYRDLFEQKGPFLYFIFMISYLITPGKFTGIFMIEVLFFTLTLYYSSKIINLIIDKKKYRWGWLWILALYALMMTTSISFIEGGSSEEFNLLFVTITVFYILKYLKNEDLADISYKDLIITGLCCGLSLMIKYTTVGLWFIMMAYICIRLIKLKRWKESILKGLTFILAMLTPFLIFSIYFYLNDSLFDFVNTYFYINIFKYSNDNNIFVTILSTFYSMFAAFFSNVILVLVAYIVFCYYLFNIARKDKKLKISKKQKLFIGMILFSLFVLYYGQSFRPYAITSMFFIVLLIIIYLYKLFYNFRVFKIASIVYIIIVLVFGIDFKYMTTNKEDIVQYRFANIINKEKNPTLLHYRSIDEGFYTAAGLLPINKYFEQVNIDTLELPESYDEQDRLIMNKKVMFVVVRKFDLDRKWAYLEFSKNEKANFNQRADMEFIKKYYDLVDVYDNYVGYYKTCTYYLFKVKE